MTISRFPPLEEAATGLTGLTAARVVYGASDGTIGQSANVAVDSTGANLLLGGATNVASSALNVLATKTVASATSAVWNGISAPAATLTLTGTTQVTTATGVNLLAIAAPTITDASAVTVDLASTLYIGGPPTAGGSATLTAPYALWIDNGITRLDGSVVIGGAAGSGNLTVMGNAASDCTSYIITAAANAGRSALFLGETSVNGLCVYYDGNGTNDGIIGMGNSGPFTSLSNRIAMTRDANDLRLMPQAAGLIGVFNVAPVVQQTSGANLTNSVTSGGSNDVIADFTSLTVYSTDAATIRNNIYQLARKVKQINDALRLYGWLT